MTYQEILKLQRENGLDKIQSLINSGQVWKFEGSYGRCAMSLLESGACMLPKKRTYDAYGSVIPSRDELKYGSKGTFQNSVYFWENNDIFSSDDFEDDIW